MRTTLATLAIALTLGLTLAQPSPWGVAVSFADPLDAVMFDCTDLFAPGLEPACFVTDADAVTVRRAINDVMRTVSDAAWFGPWTEMVPETKRERQFPTVTRFITHDSGRAYALWVMTDLSTMLTQVHVFWIDR